MPCGEPPAANLSRCSHNHPEEGLTPCAPISSLFSAAAAGILFALEKTLWAGVFILITGLFDIMDGKVAVRSNSTTLFGAFIDSVLDRYTEFFIYLGLAYYFYGHWALWLILLALLGSMMVSYTRARAEGLGVECTIGLIQRAERMAGLCLASILGAILNIFEPFMIVILGIIAAASHVIVIQRIFLIRNHEKTKRKER